MTASVISSTAICFRENNFIFVDWFSIENEFYAYINKMVKGGLQKFFLSTRKQDGEYYISNTRLH